MVNYTLRRSRRGALKISLYGRWLAAAVAAAVALIALVSVVMAPDPDTEKPERAKQAGMARTAVHTDKAVVGVDQQTTDPVTERFERAKQVGMARAAVQTDKAVAEVDQQAITLADFLERKRQVETNLAYMRGEMTKEELNLAEMQARIKLIEEAGVENTALASLINDAALYQEAIAQGYSATDEEIRSGIAEQRQIVADRKAPQGDGYIQAVGENRYWSELLPERLRRDIAIRKLRITRVKDAESRGQPRGWDEFARQTVHGATIRLLDPDAVAPATVKGALDYLAGYWQLSSRTSRLP